MTDYFQFQSLISCLRNNESNDVECVELDLEKWNRLGGDKRNFHFYFGILSEVIRNKAGIKKLSISENFLRMLTEEELIVLFDCIESLPNLVDLRMEYGGLYFSVTLLTKALRNKNISSFSFAECTLTGELADFDEFLHELKLCSYYMKRLYFINVDLPKRRFCQRIIDVLAQMQMLEILEFYCVINNEDDLVVQQIGALIANAHLQKLFLCENNFGESTGLSIANGIKRQSNASLKMLDIGFNPIGDNAGAEIILSLQQQQSSCLESLVLCSCNLGNQSARAIAGLLRCKTTTVQYLDLGENSNINDEGWEVIGNSLRNNSSLKDLSLANCNMGDRGCLALANSLLHNQTIQKIDIENNPISSTSFLALGDALEHNFILEEISYESGHPRLYQNKLIFYLLLNSSYNRNAMFRENENVITKNQYVQNMILALRDDYPASTIFRLSALYYWVRTKPMLLFE